MLKALLLIVATAFMLQSACVQAAGPATSVLLSANPDSIVADGKSVTTIVAEIRDASGELVPDGTLVSFSTDLGTIQSTATTTAGIARVRLTSGATEGTAIVSAWVTTGGAIGQVKIDLLAPGTEVSREASLTISADYLIYDAETMIIHASGGAKVMHRGLNIVSEDIQVDLQAGILKARQSTGGEPIRLTRKQRTLDASVIRYQISDLRGNAIIEGGSGKVERVRFRGSDLATEPDTEYTPPDHFDLADASEGAIVVKASSITYIPGKEMRFRRAKVFVDGKKVLSVPLHIVPIGGAESQFSRYIGWGTSGIRVDLPFYYSLSPTSTGSLRLRRGEQSGWGSYSANTGWNLDLVQDYTLKNGGEGGVLINRITSGDWGAQWRHDQEFESGARLYSYLDFPAHRDLFGMVSLSKPLEKASIGLNFHGTKLKDLSPTLSTDFYIQSLPKPIAGGAANYTLQARTSFATGNDTTTNGTGAGLQMQITGRPVKFGERTNLNSWLSVGQNWGGTSSGLSVLGNVSLLHRLGNSGSAGLAYSYTGDSGNLGLYGKHRLSGSLYYAPSSRWRANIFGTYTIDQPMSSSFADISYQFLPGWRLSVLQTFQKFDEFNYSDTEIAIGKAIAQHEIKLVWSKSRSKLRIEFAAGRF